MLLLRQALLRLRSILRRSRMENELSAELRFHLDHQIAENLAAGMPPAEARNHALRTIGNLELLKEECRDAQRVDWLRSAARDTRYAARMLAAHPAFATVAILSLALGIGVNTAIFSVFDALLLKNLPVDRPEQLVTIDAYNPRGEWNTISYPLFEEMSRIPALSDSFAAQDGFDRYDIEWDGGRRQEAQIQLVSDRYFEVLGVRPSLGRVFPPRAPSPCSATISGSASPAIPRSSAARLPRSSSE